MAAPQGLLCLTMQAAGRANSRTRCRAASGSGRGGAPQVPEFLARRAKRGGPADVDLLKGAGEIEGLFRDGRLERVEIDGDQIDGRDAVLCELPFVLRVRASCQDGSVD